MLDLFEFLTSVVAKEEEEDEVPKLSSDAKDAKAALGCDDRVAKKISSVLEVGPIRYYTGNYVCYLM